MTIELCTLALRHDELTKANIVAISLFGDGAAAVILRAGDGGVTRIENSGEHLWPDTLGIMGWSVDPEGFGVIFRRTIPDFVTAQLNPAVTQILAAMQLSMADIDRFAAICGDEDVMRYYAQPWSRERAERFIRDHVARQGDLGYSLWAVVHKAAGRLIGFCGDPLVGRWSGDRHSAADELDERLVPIP